MYYRIQHPSVNPNGKKSANKTLVCKKNYVYKLHVTDVEQPSDTVTELEQRAAALGIDAHWHARRGPKNAPQRGEAIKSVYSTKTL